MLRWEEGRPSFAIPVGRDPSRGGGSGGGVPPRRVRVLIVEDDSLVAEMYRLALTRADYDVVIAPNGESGLEQARTSRPDFAFLDVRMPRMDGIELLQHLSTDATTRDMPVVMLTNHDDGSQRRATMAMGAKDYILKTRVVPGDLPTIVERWLRHRES